MIVSSVTTSSIAAAARELSTGELRVLVLLAMLHVSALLVLISLPLAKRQIKPNSLYGLRTRATLADERVWYQANAYAARLMIRGGLAGVVLAIGLFFVPGLGELYVPVILGLLLVGALGLTWWSARYARRLAGSLDADPAPGPPGS